MNGHNRTATACRARRLGHPGGRATGGILLLLIVLANARALAWQYVSPSGSNEYPYDNWGKAAHSIQDAIDASEGMVLVAPGEYVGNVAVPECFRVHARGDGQHVIRGVAPGDPEWVSVVRVGSDAILSGFTIIAEGCYNGVTCQGAEIRDCVVIGARSIGIHADGSLVDGCTLLDNVYSGMYVSGVTMAHDTVVSGSWTGVYGIGDHGYSIVVHCTISGNREGVVNVDGMQLAVWNSIARGNSVSDIGWFSPPDVVGCNTGDLRLAGVNGNISDDPLFVGWGDFNTSDNPLHVDCSNTGEQDGTENKPFRTIGSALRAYDFHLAAGSPCIGAASDGLNMGAYPYDVATRERSPSVLINVAPGTYNEGELMVQDGVHLVARRVGKAAIIAPDHRLALWMEGSSSVRGFRIGVNQRWGIDFAPDSTPLVSGCRIFPHALDEDKESAIRVRLGARPTLAGCVIHGFPTAVEGPAVIEGCTLVHNKTAVLGPDDGEPPQIRNSIIWPHFANSTRPLVNVSPSNIAHSLVSDPALDGLNGNISADPEFVDPENGDFRLRGDSPCIDAGFNSPDLPEFDIAGMHRVMFGGKSLTVDMGAYEFYINALTPGPEPHQTTFTWSSLADKTYSIFYTDDLFNWHTVLDNFPSLGNETTSWLDDGSLTGVPPLLAPKRFYRLLGNP